MKKYEIVRKNLEFNDIIKVGKFLKNKYYVIYYKVSSYDYPRFGLAVSTKCGCAVERNKIKRQLRHLIDQNKKMWEQHTDYIVMVRKGLEALDFKEKEKYLLEILGKMRKLDEKN